MKRTAYHINRLSVPGQILFGNGATNELPSVIGGIGKLLNILIVSDETLEKIGTVDKVEKILKDSKIPFSILKTEKPEPDLDDINQCAGFAKKIRPELIIGLGGGSNIDTAKIISVSLTNKSNIKDFIGVGKIKKPGIPTIMIPTTSGTGSEVTPIAILSNKKKQVKEGIVSRHLIPAAAIVDPLLTVSLPEKLTVDTGLDAFTHAIEAYVSKKSSQITDAMAFKAMGLIKKNIVSVSRDGNNIKARCNMSLASLLAGIAFANSSVGAVHALAFPLGAMYNIPHGEANAILLPYVLAFNISGNPEKFAKIAEIFSKDKNSLNTIPERNKVVLGGVRRLLKDLRFKKPKILRQAREDIDKLAERASKITRLLKNNPRRINLKDIRKIYSQAFAKI